MYHRRVLSLILQSIFRNSEIIAVQNMINLLQNFGEKREDIIYSSILPKNREKMMPVNVYFF